MANSAQAAGNTTPPRWSLDSIYPGLESPAFAEDCERLSSGITGLQELVRDTAQRASDPAAWLQACMDGLGDLRAIHEQLDAYAYALFSVDTSDDVARTAIDAIAARAVPLPGLLVEFQAALAELPNRDSWPAEFTFLLEEQLELNEHSMSAAEERLAADLARSGADAWTRLHETISSSLSRPWHDGSSKTVVELRAMAFDPDRAVRKRAWEQEIEAWKSVEIPLSFALNGIKGTSATLNSRRSWPSTLDRSAHQNRISRRALDALIAAMKAGLPVFRRYLVAKARLLGLPQLSFYDIFAPVGTAPEPWSFDAALSFVSSLIGTFDENQADFVQRVGASQWIDAQPRPGKVGGAYCIDYPLSRESRIMTNFEGTYDSVSTLAHELGHAWHSSHMNDIHPIRRAYPMTLAETASIFTETIVFHGAMERLPADQSLYVLEQYLQGATQVIVDILSRFLFESRVMHVRADRELSADEFSSIMLDAQEQTYGAAMDPTERHPYMWAVKGHYYSADLAFYNFPYAFGQLFGLGLYKQYEDTPDGFVDRYRAMLRDTGSASAVTVTARAGFDIESQSFWDGGIAAIGRMVERFEALAAGQR